MKRFSLLLLVALTVSASAGTALAGCGWGSYYGYSSYSREYIPYFAQNPPVYYSYPVPRPYGWSPYAYPPGTMTPELQFETAPKPVTINNPFVKPETKKEATASTSESKSVALRITNPYVQQDGRPAAKLAKVRSTK